VGFATTQRAYYFSCAFFPHALKPLGYLVNVEGDFQRLEVLFVAGRVDLLLNISLYDVTNTQIR
jgi:hypothetical protein